MDNFVNSLPSKNNIKATYESYKPILSQIMARIEERLKKTIKLSSNPTYKSRVKSFNSYYRKVLRLKSEEAEKNSFVELTDMMGIRVICAFLEDLSEVEQQIKANFVVKEVEYKGAQQSFREFGYESVHVLVSIPKDCMPEQCELPLPETLVCEIQIRTILQDAWAEVEHELIYKSEFTPFDMPLRRKLASMNASLTLADIIFQEIRDYQKKLQGEVEARRASFYEKADELTLSSNPKKIENLEPKSISRVSPYVHGTIDDMILEAIQAHNHGDLDKAVEIYTIILSSEPTPPAPVLAVIHKHRGMAYFAQNNYTASLEDFQSSVVYDPNAFRSYYYIGIVLSIMNRHEEAIQAYGESIRINEYQSHAHFRRAVSYYKLGDFDNALKDVTDAQSLGLNDAETESLHAKLMEKFGMNM
ncbi:MAG: tetratricopeptide repeat protein [Treponema sp.]|nr:tetratricopeptide repeat protein [Treponema sp.]